MWILYIRLAILVTFGDFSFHLYMYDSMTMFDPNIMSHYADNELHERHKLLIISNVAHPSEKSNTCLSGDLQFFSSNDKVLIDQSPLRIGGIWLPVKYFNW